MTTCGRLLGPTVNFHEVYPSSEAFIAAQDSDAASGLRLMADAGVFFEFLPMPDFDDGRLLARGPEGGPDLGRADRRQLRPRAHDARPASRATWSATSSASSRPSRRGSCTWAGPSSSSTPSASTCSRRSITDALVTVCRRNGWTIVNFHVAPMPGSSTTNRIRGRHEWWVELKPGTLTTPTGPVMAGELDAELGRLNEDYAAKREAGVLDAPFVRLVMPGVFEHWMRYRGKWGGQYKMPRCRSDRSSPTSSAAPCSSRGTERLARAMLS